MSFDDKSLEFPKLRPVEAFPVELQGQRVVCLRDPLNFATNLVFLPPAALTILSMFDGTRSVDQILAEVTRKTYQIIPREHLEKIIIDLDASHFMDSNGFRTFQEEIEGEFRRSPVRALAHMEQASEEDVAGLGERMSEFFKEAGVKHPSENHRGQNPQARPLRGLISPHIDYGRGGPCYAQAYAELAGQTDIDLFVILGTSHSPTENFFSLTMKDYHTPFGSLQTDQEFMQVLRDGSSRDLLQDELVHRTEHSIELNAVFLRFAAGAGKARIAPILVGSFYPMVEEGRSPMDVPEVAEFVQLLQDAEKKTGRRVCYIAAADLSHIGTRFGDPTPPTADFMKWVEKEDLQSLQAAVAGNADEWFFSNATDKDRRRVCGLSPVYTFLKLMEGRSEGRLLKYQQCNEPTGAQNVAIASVAYHA